MQLEAIKAAASLSCMQQPSDHDSGASFPGCAQCPVCDEWVPRAWRVPCAWVRLGPGCLVPGVCWGALCLGVGVNS